MTDERIKRMEALRKKIIDLINSEIADGGPVKAVDVLAMLSHSVDVAIYWYRDWETDRKSVV